MKFDGPGEITPEKDLDGDWRFIILAERKSLSESSDSWKFKQM